MKLKELIDIFSCGTQYKLIGARTGKHLADNHINKDEYIRLFMNDDVSSIFPTFDAQKNNVTKVPEYVRPIICVWLIGK